MAADLNLPMAIRGAPTIRDRDGLAMSSRNAYLTPSERAIAPTLYQTLRAVASEVKAGADPTAQRVWAKNELIAAGFERVDYLEVRDAETLGPVNPMARPARVLAAAWLGRARLIDNVPV
jgi:pantoate--beta-alanine ligase